MVETLSLYAEIEGEEERIFLKDCDLCDLPYITHESLGTVECLPLGYETAGVQILFESVTEGPDDIEKLSVAFNEEIEKLPEFNQAKTLLEGLKNRTCVCKKICLNERALKIG